MTVKQVGRKKNSVTINVSGITDGDRQTSVWMPADVINSSTGMYFTLQDASRYGYITSFYVASLDDANGDIEIVVSDAYLNKGYRLLDVKVEIVKNKQVVSWLNINTILGFNYEKSATKVAGEEIDITVKDMRELNLFGYYMCLWMANPEERVLYHTLEGIQKGDVIYADYMTTPAANILTALYANIANFVGINFSGVVEYLVSAHVRPGDAFRAYAFNNIKSAINGFNISKSV
ncbi:MAG: hypothetical protein IIW54_12730 [Lachnospiraceae bacterium]|nr:hypothetical protein [Lachnospiraceae bacterium]